MGKVSNIGIEPRPNSICVDGNGKKTYGFPLHFRAENTRTYLEKATTIVNGSNPGFHNGAICNMGNEKMETVVRRLTPTEYERLQNFPDGWTNIGEWTDTKGKVHKESSDTARYKALGNSIALPFWFWLMRRISAQYERPATLGSLFSGIGGFDLCWVRCNGTGTVLWSSEIEEFPIAVMKRHFGDEETGTVGDVKEYL